MTTELLIGAGALIVVGWTLTGRLLWRLSRDLQAVAQRVAYLEGRQERRLHVVEDDDR